MALAVAVLNFRGGGHARTASIIEVLVEDIDRLARDVKQMKATPPFDQTQDRISPWDRRLRAARGFLAASENNAPRPG
jgi:hypothetical protein